LKIKRKVNGGGKKKKIELCEWVVLAGGRTSRKRERRCRETRITKNRKGGKKKKHVYKNAMESCGCACAAFVKTDTNNKDDKQQEDETTVEDGPTTTSPSARSCPVQDETVHGGMISILNGEECTNNRADYGGYEAGQICPYDYKWTGCTFMDLACEPRETCKCNRDNTSGASGDGNINSNGNGVWECAVVDHEFEDKVQCLDSTTPAPSPSPRPTSDPNQDRNRDFRDRDLSSLERLLAGAAAAANDVQDATGQSCNLGDPIPRNSDIPEEEEEEEPNFRTGENEEEEGKTCPSEEPETGDACRSSTTNNNDNDNDNECIYDHIYMGCDLPYDKSMCIPVVTCTCDMMEDLAAADSWICASVGVQQCGVAVDGIPAGSACDPDSDSPI